MLRPIIAAGNDRATRDHQTAAASRERQAHPKLIAYFIVGYKPGRCSNDSAAISQQEVNLC
jgi:hypothetical protein